MHQKWIMNQLELEKLEVDVEHLRSNGVMTTAGRFLTGMKASDEAKVALIAALSQLQGQIQDMLCAIRED